MTDAELEAQIAALGCTDPGCALSRPATPRTTCQCVSPYLDPVQHAKRAQTAACVLALRAEQVRVLREQLAMTVSRKDADAAFFDRPWLPMVADYVIDEPVDCTGGESK